MSTYQRTGKRIFFFTVFFMAVLLFAGKGNVQAKRKSVALNKTTVTAYKGMAPVKLKVKNVKKGKNIIWFSSKSSVAKVSQDGTVTFHKKGNAIVQAKVGKKTLKCIVSVCSKKAYKAVEKAKKFHSARNMSYSQGNRMGKRSADCSSFCGRCYLPQGITMGGSTSWCNTAAGMALWSTKKGKVVANGGVSIGKKKLLPGDLVFYKKGYNGRYKNIYHVEIFVGYEWRNNQLVGYTMSSITGNYPSILKRDYTSRKGRVAQIARPAQ
ncbi:MAG: C40 family peptidase [Eubacterium sp.]|nr:C40 family peptidase [Eubacterium sp.]